MSKIERDEFEELVKPLIKFLNDRGHPHMKIIVNTGGAELIEGLIGMTAEEFYLD